MTRRLVLMTTGVVLAIVVATVRVEATGHDPDVEAAFAALALPSIPQALPESTEFGDGGFTIDEPCSKVLADYQAAGSPAPANATVTAGPGRLTFVNPYGTSAVIAVYELQGAVVKGIPTAEPPTCQYLVLASPDITITGSAAGAPLAAYGPVGCGIDSDDQPSFFAAYDTPAGVQLMALSDRGNSGPRLVMVPDAVVAAVGPDRAFSDPSAQSFPYHDLAQVAGVVSLTIDTPTGPASVAVRCTGSTLEVPDLMKYAGR